MNSRRALALIPALALSCALASCGGGSDSGAHLAGRAQLRIAPEKPYATSALTATLAGEALPTAARWEWRRNGSSVSGADGATLPAAELHHGDRVSVRLSFPDGRTFESAEVLVANSPPRIGRVSVVNEEGGLAAQVEATDPDGDATTFRYQWYRNGKPMPGEQGARYIAREAAFGDGVSVEVVAHDGSEESSPVRADVAALDNRAPQFASTPAAPERGSDFYRYALSATDADGDAVTFSLVRGPEGMSIGPDGAVVWRLPPLERRRGEYEVVVRASDPKGASVEQAFQLRVEAAPRAK